MESSIWRRKKAYQGDVKNQSKGDGQEIGNSYIALCLLMKRGGDQFTCFALHFLLLILEPTILSQHLSILPSADFFLDSSRPHLASNSEANRFKSTDINPVP